MSVEVSAGGVIVRHGLVLLVRQSATNTWAFPKGHVEGRESLLDAARREIHEETGLAELRLICVLGRYSRGSKKSPAVVKHISMYLFEALTSEVKSRAEDVLEGRRD